MAPKPIKTLFAPGYVAIVDALIAKRKTIGMSQYVLADKYGEDQSFISRVERKQRRLDAYEFARWCKILNLDPGAVLKHGLAVGEDNKS